jgi:hypothetical protein
MDYKKIYESIIEKAKSEDRQKRLGIYYENHHILPRCMGGSDKKENLVLLTGREHFVCHKLLTVIYPHNRKLALAFHKMAFSKRKIYGMTNRDYEYARKLISEIPLSKEERTNIGKRTKGKTYEELYGDKAEEQKEKRRQALLGKKRPKEVCEKMSNSLKGKNPWNKGLNKNNDERVKKYTENSKSFLPYKLYTITFPNGEEVECNGKKEVENLFSVINKNLPKKSRINVDILCSSGEVKGYKLEKKNKKRI